MSELWLRLGLIAGALLVAGAVTLILRARATGAPQKLTDTGLTEGFYLFTSSGCSACRPARNKIRESFGDEGFVELNWEREPGLFFDLGIDAVPATLVVAADGSGVLYPGQPDKMLEAVGP